MKLNFDISPTEYKIIHAILIKYLNNEYKVKVFGSRAKNETKYNSDLDLAIEHKNKIDYKLLRKIKQALEEAKIAFKVDVSDLNALSENFKSLIEKDMVRFPLTFKSSIPLLRFEEFSGEYKQYLFNDIFMFSTGKNIKQNEASPEFEIPCVRYGELYHMYREVITKIINRTNLDKSELSFSKGDEILLPSAGEDPLDIGSASALTIKNIAIGRTINILRPLVKNMYEQRYVSYYINEKLKKKISTLAKGSSISNVYNSDLKKLKIILPLIKEQQKIASFLIQIDKKQEHLTKKLELLKTYKKGVMQKIFSQEIRFKKDDGGEFEDWEDKYGNEIFVNSSNKKHNSDLPILAISQEYGAIPRDMIDYKMQVTEKSIASYKVIDIGDFIISLRSFQGGLEYSTYHGICSPAYIILKPIVSIECKFFKEFFKTHNYIQELNKKLEGIRDGKMISYKYFSEIKLPFPSILEQTKIANFLTTLDKKITSTKEQLEQTKAFKKGLLQKMFV